MYSCHTYLLTDGHYLSIQIKFLERGVRNRMPEHARLLAMTYKLIYDMIRSGELADGTGYRLQQRTIL